MIAPSQALFCVLQAVTKASGSDGDPQALRWTHDYRNAFRAHSVTASLAMASIGMALARYFGPGFALDDETKRDILDLAVQEAARQGTPHANFQMDLTLDTTLGTMAVTMFQQNGGEL